jgi:hypothetical protein
VGLDWYQHTSCSPGSSYMQLSLQMIASTLASDPASTLLSTDSL